jgi:fructose-1,6-bisphosphatase I
MMISFLSIAAYILAIVIVAPTALEAFVSPQHGAKISFSGDAMRTMKMDHCHDNVGIPIHYIHGKTKVGNRGMYPSASAVLEKTTTPLSTTSTNGRLTLTTFLEGQPLESVFTSIQRACRDISKLVHQASFGTGGGGGGGEESNFGVSGLHQGGGSINIQGEEQKKLDVMANEIMKHALAQAGTVKILVSEEEDVPISLRLSKKSKKMTSVDDKSYIVAFDPLDGSSNIDVGIPVGTIFGIFEHHEGDDHSSLDAVLQPGRKLVAAGYCLYSAATTLVITLGDGVYGFTLDETLGGGGQFVLSHPNMRIPTRGSIYSFNEGNRWDWDEPVQRYITNIQKGCGEVQGKKYSGRLVGSMVADIHRTLQYGGIFGYPADTKNPNGKLRLLYEAAPMAFLVEQAGGRGTTGTFPLMDVQPVHLHERVPCILGSKDDVKELESYYYTANTKSKKINNYIGGTSVVADPDKKSFGKCFSLHKMAWNRSLRRPSK